MTTAELNERIDALDDVDEAYDLMDELGVNTKGLKGIEDAKTRLRVHVSKNMGGRASQPNQDVITNLLNEDQERRQKLTVIYNKIKEFLGRMPESKMADLRRAFPNLDHELEAVEKNLKYDKCAILVAGETSAGKSTLLNLLLGRTKTSLLPVAHLSVTSVICELKYDDHPYAVAHPWPDDVGAKSMHIPLGEQTADQDLSRYVYQQTDRSERRFPWQRVEIFWPSEWLRAGVTIVDSPGVGENEEMTNLVKEYMPKAFGFIYVINSANAGGVQEDRLEDLLLSFTTSNKPKKDDEGVWQFDPRSAIFVANKWDCVPRDERKEVKDMVYSKLENIWSGLSRSQVFFLSASQALASMKEDVVNEDYGTLLDGVENLLPVGLTQAITKQFSQLSAVMKNATRILRTYVTQLEVSDMEREATCEEAMERLHKIEKRPRAIERELESKMNEEIDEGIAKAKAHLTKPNVIGYVCKWSDDQCPESNNMEVLEERMYAYALKRIRNELHKWDKENKIFEGIQQRLLDELKSKFLSLEAELARVERLMTLTDAVEQAQQLAGRLPEDSDVDDIRLSTTAKVIMGLSAPVWVPLGLVVGLFALPAYGVKEAFKKRKEKKKLKEYNQNKAREMERATKVVLSSILNTSSLKNLLEEKVGTTLSLVKKMVSRIPDMIEADKQIVEKLKQKRGDDDLLLKELHPLQQEAIILEGEMDLLYLLSIKSYDYKENDLLGWSDRPVAQGNFAKIYESSLKIPGEPGPTQCAVKVLKDPESQDIAPLSELNASEIWLEESNLRKLQHEHVVKYFGTARMTRGPSHYLLMVMEFCSCSLESFIEDGGKYSAPAKQRNDEDSGSLLCATDLAWQIADGIAGIHALGFVHRDLKPANILVNRDGKIKLADLGLAKSEVKLTGTLAGTLLYMAPEIINVARYNRSADMFSYGHILWELWYGKKVSKVYTMNNLKTLPNQAFTEHRRPEGTGTWRKTMIGCWSEKPEARPTAASCRLMFAKYKNTLKPKRK